nr:hypothetical protein [Tanacetum cinerariifolium]
VNGDIQLQSLIDDKKVVVTKAIIRRDLHLDDVDGVECLPNVEIFEELTRMGYEKPPPKQTFYKALISAQWIFDSMVRNVDNLSKFLMYQRFIQVLLDHRVNDMTTHNTKHKSHALILNVFANIRRVGKGLSGVETLLFDSMLVQSQQQAEVGVEDRNSQALEILQLKKRVKRLERKKKSKTSRLKRLRRVGADQRVESSFDTVLGAEEDASKQGGK